jgi:hypothetical protein
MTVRIPTRVNRILDLVATPPHAPITAAVSVLAVAAVGLVWVSHTAAAATAGVLGVVLVAACHIVRVAAWKDRAVQAESDLRIAEHKIAQLEAGDPSAPTAQLRTIGETGERT